MKIRARHKISPIHLFKGDTVILSYHSTRYLTGDEEIIRSHIGRDITVNEAVIFDIEQGDFDGAEDGIGGALLNHKGELNEKD